MSRMRAVCCAGIVLMLVMLTPPACAGGRMGFVGPCEYPGGIDGSESGGFYHVDNWDGDVYSVAPDGEATWLFSIAEATGEQYTNYHGMGLCFVPSRGDERSGTLYVTRPDRGAPPYTDYVRVFTTDGTHLGTYDVSDIVDRPHGIAFDGTHLWLSGDAAFVKCDMSFNEIDTYVAPWGTGSGALDYDPVTGFLYSAGLGDWYITVMDLECSVVHQWYLSSTYRVGIAVGEVTTRDTRSLWVVDNTTVTIEEIEDVYLTPVDASSWGWIKSLFR
ncbi:MAG: hypothetical protein GF405_07435 [Candidatus Eisenbacteria bacterium]|nr:hypothetical protein [Candidatus Eisenbacteria bacterium]